MKETCQPKIIIYNYFIPNLIPYDSFFKGISNSSFKPHNDYFSIRNSITKRKEIDTNQIIVSEDDISINVNENKKTETNSKNTNSEKTTQISIEIEQKPKKDKNIEFLNKKRLFSITEKKKYGRKHKDDIEQGYHTKFSTDNILRKAKVKFLKVFTDYTNKIISKKYASNIPALIPLESNIAQNNSKSFNLELINSKFKDIFLKYDINKKYRKHEKDDNKKTINQIYENNDLELKDILEMTFLEVFLIFSGKIKNEKFEEMEKMDKILEELNKKYNDETYTKKVKSVLLNFESFYSKKDKGEIK